ncbi:hypothetical protein N7478_000316 [Penicillium angulare]|uniref:uncharacterized protein n=1 Tax=Penicillium angulare TaxID=116970 RepID=UPI002540C7F9|nr:uncharacterized protein N7478_000316 [Penicillium angulare]KAJ5291065.1 hypothetical protein N7478_000316 [Penicillium angulare]
MLSKLVLVIASVVSMANSQYTPYIDPSSVPLATRENWCLSQKYACPILCMQMPNTTGAYINTCSPVSLNYLCQCSNGLSPNGTEYSQTIPYYVCTEANNQCVAKCTDSLCQASCRSDHPCGAQAPKRVNVSTTTTTTSATSTATANITNALGSHATGDASRVMAMDIGHFYGLCALIGGFTAGFAVLM